MENEWGSEIIMTYDSSNSFLLKRMLTLQYAPKFLTPLEDIKAEINDKMYVLINVYAPNKHIDIIHFLNIGRARSC